MERFLTMLNNIFYNLYIIHGLCISVFFFIYIYTETIKYLSFSCLCFVLSILFGKLEFLTMKILLEKY